MWNISVATLVWIYFICFTTANPHNRIVGGGETTELEFPFMVAINYRGPDRRCSGTLLSKQHVLTAASCVLTYSTAKLNITLNFGTTNRFSDGIVRSVEEVIFPQDSNKLLNKNSIAILRLNESVKFMDSIKPIPLASSKPALGTNVVVTGWSNSYISKGDKEQPLLWSDFTVFPSIINRKMSLYHAPLNFFCPSDSGSAVVYNGELAGITESGGGICGFPYFKSAINVDDYSEWIEQYSNLNEESE